MQLLLGILFFLLGATLASFTTVISERMYTGQSWLQGRSRCNSCRRTLTVLDLVPIFSWVTFLGKCRTCRAKVPGTYAFFELVTGIVFVFSYYKFGLHLQLLAFLVACIVLLFIVLYDLRHTIVPWGSSLLLLISSAIFGWMRATSVLEFEFSVLVAFIIGIGFLLLHLFSQGRAMGLGDTPVAFSLSLLVGSAAALPGLVFSFWIGAVIGILLLVFRRGGPKMGIEVPFVPFLAMGYLLAFFTTWNPFL